MPALPRPADWPDEILELVVAEFTGTISIWDPASEGKAYNATTDSWTGGTPSLVIEDRIARIVALTVPVPMLAAEESVSRRRYRFQILLEDDDPPILNGMLIQVVDGGRDQDLENYSYTVTAASNSTQAPVRTILAFSDNAPVSWDFTVPAPDDGDDEEGVDDDV